MFVLNDNFNGQSCRLITPTLFPVDVNILMDLESIRLTSNLLWCQIREQKWVKAAELSGENLQQQVSQRQDERDNAQLHVHCIDSAAVTYGLYRDIMCLQGETLIQDQSSSQLVCVDSSTATIFI